MTSNRGRRRAEARARARRRRRVVLALVAAPLAVVASLALFAAVRDDSSSDRDGSDAERRPRPDAERSGSTRDDSRTDRDESLVVVAPTEYRIVYRIDDFAGGTRVTTTEELRVRRPFEASLERRTGPPPGTAVTSLQVSRLGRLTVPATGADSLTLAVPPDLASGDMRFDIALDTLLDNDVATAREWRRVNDRPCRVHRFQEPIATGEPKTWDGGDDYADLCINERGLLLEEVWVTSGRVLRRKVAVEVADRAELTAEMLADRSEPLGPDQGGGSSIALDPESSPVGTSWSLSLPPEGFGLVGRYSIEAPRQGAAPVAGGGLASLVDVWVRGHDVLLLEQGSGPPPDAPAGETVELPGVGTASIVLGFRTNAVEVWLDASFVRLRGTLVATDLVDIARGIESRHGGEGLRPLEPSAP